MILVFIIYFCLVLAIAFLWSRKVKHNAFFVHERRAGTFLLFVTSLATAIGGGTIFTLVQFGYVQGLSAIIICGAIGGGLFLTTLLGGKIRNEAWKEKLFTLPEFLEKRFDQRSKKIAIAVNLLSYLFLAALQLLALATVGVVFLGMDINLALLLSWLIVVAYTCLGGLRSDIVTDVFQFIFLFPIIPILLWYGIKFSGGIQALRALDLAPMPVGSIRPILLIILAVGVWMPSIIGSMDLWQRIYAAKSEKSAKQFLFFSGLFLFLILLIFSLAGIIYRGVDFLKGIEPGLIPAKIISALPVTFSIFLLIGLLSAFMSTGDSMLMVLSATWTHDIYKSWRKVKDEDKLLMIGRASVIFFGLLALALAKLFPNFVQLLGTALSSLAVLTPSIIGALYAENINPRSAFWSIFSGFIIILITLGITFITQNIEFAFMGQLLAFAVSLLVFLLLFRRIKKSVS